MISGFHDHMLPAHLCLYIVYPLVLHDVMQDPLLLSQTFGKPLVVVLTEGLKMENTNNQNIYPSQDELLLFPR